MFAATKPSKIDIPVVSPIFILKMVFLLLVFLTIRGWNPVIAGPAEIDEVKVVNDQYTPDSSQHPSPQAADCKTKDCNKK
jgi:hypothetical protein